MSTANAPSRGIFVLGMHRSGTSALTRVLNLMGSQLGSDLLGVREGNELGHWEPVRVIEINERILAAIGRSWSDPREMDADWQESLAVQALMPEAKLLLEHEYRPHAFWSIKDPRLSRLLPFWRQAVSQVAGLDVSAVIALRHPWEAASSLNRRDGIPLTQGFLLWLHHTREALLTSQGLKRVIIGFDHLLVDWKAEVRRLSSTLDIPIELDEESEGALSVNTFLDFNARHEKYCSDKMVVPASLLELFDKLNRARNEEDIQAAMDFANSIMSVSECLSRALTDIYVHRERIHARVVELEVAASRDADAAGLETETKVLQKLGDISLHLSHADWVNSELDKRWRSADGELQQLRQTNQVQAERNIRLQFVLDANAEQLESLSSRLRAETERCEKLAGKLEWQLEKNKELSSELLIRDATICSRIKNKLMKWGGL